MISLEGLLKYLLKKWKLMLAIIAVCAMVFAGSVYFLYETVVEETSVLEEYYGKQVELYRDILENEDSTQKEEAFFQEEWKNSDLYYHFKEELRIAPIGYMEQVSVGSAAVFGAVVGAVLAVSAGTALYQKKELREKM